MALKYEYKPSVTTDAVPCAQLVKGAIGIIHRVDFYSEQDFFRDRKYVETGKAGAFNFGLASPFIQEALGTEDREGFQTLEVLTDELLQKLIPELKARFGANYEPVLEELKELRELESNLRTRIGDYRQFLKIF